jgi:hypothetical protein
MKKYLICLTLLIFTHPLFAQRHLPDLQIFTTDENVQLDTIAENPAINNGITTATVPQRGENLSLQIFIPRCASLLGFEYAITFSNSDSSLTRSFQILSVTDWRQQPLKQTSNSQTISYYNNRLEFAPLPSTGHIATVLLTPRQQLHSPLPIHLACSVTIVSNPPRRVWQMRGTTTLRWQ